MSDILVAYFSATGVTRRAAQTLSEAIGADIYEIKPAVPYTQADLNWQDQHSRSTIEMRDKSSRPALADKNAPIQGHKVIFLGFPIWWYVAPTIINTFLEAYNFSGKTIVLFATSGGSGFGQTVAGLENSVADSARIIPGKLLNGNPRPAGLREWVDRLGI
ncbi:MAG: flavodoxin [bacterium]|nr:flavodoxin [bacterium]